MSENESSGQESTDVTCPTCGRDDFSKPQGMKTHHKQIHGESIAGVDTECAYCDTPFLAQTTHAERNENNFCSRDCYANWLSENNRGENHPRWREPVVVNCAYCDTSKEVAPSISEERTRHFCDRECLGMWQSENNRGERHPLWVGESESHSCQNCEETVYRRPADVYESGRVFCSRECYHEWGTGPNSGKWNGGYREYYGSHWSAVREAVLDRDSHRCQSCGLSSADHAERHGGRGLCVHHIRRRESFDPPERGDVLSNLVALCSPCHMEWEGLPIRPTLIETALPDD